MGERDWVPAREPLTAVPSHPHCGPSARCSGAREPPAWAVCSEGRTRRPGRARGLAAIDASASPHWKPSPHSYTFFFCPSAIAVNAIDGEVPDIVPTALTKRCERMNRLISNFELAVTGVCVAPAMSA
jgi:hypothetical protein